MRPIQYEADDARKLFPLLESIAHEIEERSLALETLEAEIERLSRDPRRNERALHQSVAEAAAHRRGLRHAKDELERLGCSVVGTAPLTLRIPGRVGEAKHSFVWQTGDPVLK